MNTLHSQPLPNHRNICNFGTHFTVFRKELEAAQHRLRAVRFTRGFAYRLFTIEEIIHFLSQQPEAVNYRIRVLVARLLADHNWQPNFAVLLLIGFCLPYIISLHHCPVCRLPHGIWCDSKAYSRLL